MNTDSNATSEARKQFSIYLPVDIYEQLVSLAEADDRSLVSYVRNVLKKHVRQECVDTKK